MKRLLFPLMAAVLVVFTSACEKVERIEVKPATVTLGAAGESAPLGASALTAEGKAVADMKFEYTSSNPQVATVDASGKVSAVKSGTATITVKAGEKSATASVDVRIPASIAIKDAPFTLTGVGATAPVEGSVLDDAGRPLPDAKLEYTSSDATIVQVTGNTLVASAPGTTTVKATAHGLEQSFEVSVKLPEVASLAFEAAPASIKVGESAPLVVLAKGTDGAAINGVTFAFTSSDEKVATVDASGKVTAIKAGAASIIATGADKTVETQLTVLKK